MISQKNHSPQRSAYFIGIGGIGISYLARYLADKGWRVSGSDAQRSSITNELNKEGIKVKIGHSKADFGLKTAPGEVFDRIIYNRAIRPDNPEFKAAHKANIPLIPYAEALGEITQQYETIAITGSHGKSTTTALSAVTLIRAKLDPTVFVGTKLPDLGGRNIRIGKSKWLVLEADDYQAAFLSYSPSIAIVTNIDREHMDFYKTFVNVKRAFLGFLARTRQGGTLILNRDDAPLWSLRAKITVLAKKNALTVIWYSRTDAVAARVKKHLSLSGPHNLSNALAAYALGRRLNIPQTKILAALHSYRGAWRRMEYRGDVKMGVTSVKIFDDYAHHPSEIKATIAAFREKFPHAPLLVAFQPHQARRLEVLFKEFQGAFDGADVVWISPIYKVAGRDEDARLDSAALVRAIQKRSPARLVFYLEDLKRLGIALKEIIATPLFRNQKQAVLVMMGAGNIVGQTDGLLLKHNYKK